MHTARRIYSSSRCCLGHTKWRRHADRGRGAKAPWISPHLRRTWASASVNSRGGASGRGTGAEDLLPHPAVHECVWRDWRAGPQLGGNRGRVRILRSGPLIRDCKEFSGNTPAALLSKDADLARHFYLRFGMSHSSNLSQAKWKVNSRCNRMPARLPSKLAASRFCRRKRFSGCRVPRRPAAHFIFPGMGIRSRIL
jgi:hypothetical protein